MEASLDEAAILLDQLAQATARAFRALAQDDRASLRVSATQLKILAKSLIDVLGDD